MNRENLHSQKIIYDAVLIFLFLFFFQFMGSHKMIFFATSTLLGGLICLGYAWKQKKLRVAVPEIILVLSFFSYTLISKMSISFMILFMSLPPLFLLIGKYLSKDIVSEKNSGSYIFRYIMLFVSAYTLHGLLNCLIYFRDGFCNGGREWSDVWGEVLPATQHSLYTLPVLSLMFLAFLCWKKYKALCTGAICIGIFFLFQAAHSSSRTQIMIWILIVFWEALLFILLNRKDKVVMGIIKRCAVILAAACVILAVFFIVNYNSLQNLELVQTFQRGGGILHNVRFQAQIRVLQQLFVYPFGNTEMDLGGLYYAHNVWLDMAKATGVIPFFLLLIYTVISLVDMVKFLLDTSVAPGLKYMSSGLYFALLLYYMVEPALDANIAYLIPWFYLHGIVNGYLKDTAN